LYGYLEWDKLPKGSIRAKYNMMEADVWPFMTEQGKMYKWTVLDTTTGYYIASGQESIEDDSCEQCVKVINY
jgi:hypothetical protein